MINLTYVSESRIAAAEVMAEIGVILACANERNAREQITGALLFTGTYFVQTLEGRAARVDALLNSIVRDRRHAALVVIDRHAVTTGKFPRWSLTYVGPSVFVAETVARGVAGFTGGIPSDVVRLVRMMAEFGAASPLKR